MWKYEFDPNRVVTIDNSINQEIAGDVNGILLGLMADPEPILIRLNTPGGAVSDGLAMYDTIREVNVHAPVFIQGVGMVASMGTVIMMAVPKEQRLLSENVEVMIHQASIGELGGKLKSIRNEYEYLERLNARLFNILRENLSKGNTTQHMLDRLQKDSWDEWLFAEEASTHGFGKVLKPGQLGIAVPTVESELPETPQAQTSEEHDSDVAMAMIESLYENGFAVIDEEGNKLALEQFTKIEEEV